jgi:N-acetylneuraminic acid mutarotase
MGSARAGHTATLLGSGKVLVAGGFAGGEAGAAGPARLASAELYDPNDETWTATSGMGSPRAGHTATLLDGDRVLVTGGDVDEFANVAYSAEVYASSSGTWTATEATKLAHVGHTATLLPDGTVLVVGGVWSVPAYLPLAELYVPSGGS